MTKKQGLAFDMLRPRGVIPIPSSRRMPGSRIRSSMESTGFRRAPEDGWKCARTASRTGV